MNAFFRGPNPDEPRNETAHGAPSDGPHDTTPPLYTPPLPTASATETRINPSDVLRAKVEKLSFWYGDFQALNQISMPVYDRRVTALIGPSGCGKSTLLRCFNRMHDLYPNTRYHGRISLHPDAYNIVSSQTDPLMVRLGVGMVFQRPNPFPKSIFENVVCGLKVRGIKDKTLLAEKAEKSLRQAALWNEVKDKLLSPAYDLSGGQQQRLCIARALAVDPDLLLLDEPTSALDPIATSKIENLVLELARSITIVIVTHNMQQAARISRYTAFMHLGSIVEFAPTEDLFTAPREERTRSYITGRYG